MKFVKKITLFLTVLILCSSCFKKPTPLELLSNQEPLLRSQERYNSYLALEYLRFSRKLLAAQDEKSSAHFAKKGRDSALGLNVIPENPLIWKADGAQIASMVLMQKRLEDVLLASQIKSYLPIQTAHLTYLYDCWISRESKQIFRADELAQCRVHFAKLLDEIETYIEELKKDRTKIVRIIEPEFERFEIDFDLDVAKLNDEGSKKLIEFLKYIKGINANYKLLIVGNTDRSGAELYNQSLATKRADVVENYLIKNGVHKDFIEKRSVGEDFPDVLTKDNNSNQINRNVAIYVLKGHGSFSAYPLPLLENIVYKKEVEKARQDRGLDAIN
jgi:outer membrane protein OmpA-like peptidoglycan-associated protein